MLLWSCLQQTRDLKNAAAGLVWTRDCRDVFQEVAIEPMEAFLPWDSIERCPRKSVLEVLKMPAYQQLIKFTRFVLHRITSSCQILSVWCLMFGYVWLYLTQRFHHGISTVIFLTQHAVRGFHVGHLSLLRVYIPSGIFPLKIVISHSFLYVYQRVYGSNNGQWSNYNIRILLTSSSHQAKLPIISHPFPSHEILIGSQGYPQ